MKTYLVNYTVFSWETGNSMGSRTEEFQAESEWEARQMLVTEMCESGTSYCINGVQVVPAQWLRDIAHQKFCAMRDCPQCPYDGCWCEGSTDETCKTCPSFIRWMYGEEPSGL